MLPMPTSKQGERNVTSGVAMVRVKSQLVEPGVSLGSIVVIFSAFIGARLRIEYERG